MGGLRCHLQLSWWTWGGDRLVKDVKLILYNYQFSILLGFCENILIILIKEEKRKRESCINQTPSAIRQVRAFIKLSDNDQGWASLPRRDRVSFFLSSETFILLKVEQILTQSQNILFSFHTRKFLFITKEEKSCTKKKETGIEYFC